MNAKPGNPGSRRRSHRFVFYGDCCSGVPGGPFEQNFAEVNAVVQREEPGPDFFMFLGDHINGLVSDEGELRRQWRYWQDTEMAWLQRTGTPMYHLTSNHNTFDSLSERVWRDVFPNIPENGPPGQQGLSYWVRHDDLLLVFANTSFSGLGGYGHVECEWLGATLSEHADARHRIVSGHHPVWPVNGYAERPGWCIVEEEAQAFWTVLMHHGVSAYLCSHIIAFDVQEHGGIPQVCSGGAGTNYGPGGFMGAGEYHHFVRATLDAEGFRLESVDTDGRVREQYSRPLG